MAGAALALPEPGRADLGILILEAEVNMAGCRARQVRDFALDPEPRDALLEQGLGLRLSWLTVIGASFGMAGSIDVYPQLTHAYNRPLPRSRPSVPAMRIAKEALTFDDVLLQPGYSEVLPREVDLSTSLTREIRLSIPLLSAAMDTVTESRLAIALAQEGGLGVIHKNMTVEEQARQVLMVKKFESGMVRNPITVSSDMTIREVIELTRSMGISGVPVVDEASRSASSRAATCASRRSLMRLFPRS